MQNCEESDNAERDSADRKKTSAAIETLLQGLQEATRELSTRFVETMPSAYFHDIDQQTQLSHIKALVAVEASGISQVISLRNRQGTVFTFISDQSYPGQLGRYIRQLPKERPLQSAKVYTAADGSRVLDVFRFRDTRDGNASGSRQPERKALLVEKIRTLQFCIDLPALDLHLSGCSEDYLDTTPAEQVLRQFCIAGEVRKTGHVWLELAAHDDSGQSQLTIGIPRADNRLALERITEFLGNHEIDIQRAYLDTFSGARAVSVLSFLVRFIEAPLETDCGFWLRIRADLKRLIYLDDEVFALSRDLGNCALLDAEILLGLGRLVHQRLVKQNPLLFARERIHRTLFRHPELSLAIAAQFQKRFSPGCNVDSSNPTARINDEVENPEDQIVLTALLHAVEATLRTNIWLENRSALALRLDPAFFSLKGKKEIPYGVFFVTGLDFDGFHVRFRDIARGGVRIVRPVGQEQYALASERHYEECYGLASAQQLKNKDIPEGGSKGVILARPGAEFEQAGLAYADALLDLIIPAPELMTNYRDYLKQSELLYLGPDENISNDLIESIVERARLRGYPMPNAFMSSKPGAGINHKKYGVTSEGVTVFLEYALKEVGIDPRSQPFTIKITGGPDGDVAGNEIRILLREYGNNVRILAIADGSGSLEDPAGLDMTELIRLVDCGLPVSQFSRQLLGRHGSLTTVQEPGGIKLRDTMHNRIVADAFIPAGGRPRTINHANWRDYLDAEGTPKSKVIVEGANLFITPKARKQLSNAGVLIIKDSSANKCGVICSSYEIIASMLLEEREFLRIKDQFIEQVLEKLRYLASTEAQSLFKERSRHRDSDLPTLSIVLSTVINRASDALATAMGELHATYRGLTRSLVEQHVPPVLLETCGEALYSNIPGTYLHCIMAARLASRIVYSEGMSWFNNRNDREIVELASQYLQEEARVNRLITTIRETDLPGRNEIAHLLETGGIAAAMKL